MTSTPAPLQLPEASFGVFAYATPTEKEYLLDAPYGEFHSRLRKIKKRLYMRGYMRQYRKKG